MSLTDLQFTIYDLGDGMPRQFQGENDDVGGSATGDLAGLRSKRLPLHEPKMQLLISKHLCISGRMFQTQRLSHPGPLPPGEGEFSADSW